MIYEPDTWVAFRVKRKRPAVYKILAGWDGGYLHGTQWRINSGIEKIEEDEKYFYFIGHTGSVYKCSKAMERFSGSTGYVWDIIKAKATLTPSKKLVKAFKERK